MAEGGVAAWDQIWSWSSRGRRSIGKEDTDMTVINELLVLSMYEWFSTPLSEVQPVRQ